MMIEGRKTLTIIGCGKVGQTLGFLWEGKKVFSIQQLMDRTLEGGRIAAKFIGSGTPAAGIEDLQPADVFLIAANDDAIMEIARVLASSPALRDGAIVFHVSGGKQSSALRAILSAKISVASVHPVMSFISTQHSIVNFQGTHCGCEGEERALAVLIPAFEAIGGRCFQIAASEKMLYHAALVLACNHLTALTELGMRLLSIAGVPDTVAPRVLEPLMRGTLENIFRAGTAAALTGPIARGDHLLVGDQLRVLQQHDRTAETVYRALAEISLELAAKQGTPPERLAELRRTLDSGPV